MSVSVRRDVLILACAVSAGIHGALVPALAAGMRLDPFPILLCWDRPPTDFERYLPVSPGML